MRKITSWAVLLAFLVSCIMPPNGFAQMIEGVGLMPEPGAIVRTSPAFVPAHLMGVMINARDPLKFDFLIRKGEGTITADEKNVEYRKLIKYFLAAMTIPDSDQWVNLSPYENDRIIQENFGMTEMGRDLLAQDYLLKQLTASLIHPDTELGKTFWERVYKRAQAEFGTTDIPLNAFNKVWITPDKATVWEKGNAAYVIESHLKVLTEQDYVSLQKNSNSSVFGTDQASSQEVNEVARISGDIVRDVLIPEIEKEVNEGKNFAPLRQIFASMILATWYKKALKESLLGEVYADRAKVKGVDQDPRNNTMIYDQYLAAFKKGVVNLIKEDIDEYSQEIIPRKYFSGGYDPEGMKRAFKRDSSQVPPPAARRLLDDAQGSNVDLAQVALNAAPSGTATQKVPAKLSLPVQKTLTQDPAQSLVENLMIQGGRMLATLQARGGEKYTNPALPSDDRTAYELLRLTFQHMVNMVRASDGAIKDQQRQMAQATHGLYLQIAPLIPNYVPVKFSDISDFAQVSPVNDQATPVRNAAMNPQEVLRQVLDAGPNRWISVAEPASGEVVIQRGLSGAAEMDSYQGDGVQEALRILRGEESTNKRSFSVASGKASLDQLTYEVTDQYTGPLAMRFAVRENMLDRSGLSDEHVFATGVGRENIVQVGLFGNRTDPLGWARAYLQMVKESGTAFTPGSIGENFYKEVLNIEAKKVLEDTEFGKRIVNADEIGRMYRDLFADSRFREAQQPVVPLQGPAVQADKAMKGGIDLNAVNLNMQIKRDGNGVALPMSQQNLENIRIDGLIPEILSIVPAATLPMLSEAAGSSGSSV